MWMKKEKEMRSLRRKVEKSKMEISMDSFNLLMCREEARGAFLLQGLFPIRIQYTPYARMQV